MIAPRSSAPEEPVPVPPPLDLRRAVDEFFRPGGLMEKASHGSGFAFEVRPQQREMALAVAEALEQGRHLAVEAGTGVGKSFAYLVPLILAARARQVQAVVSTYTIGLQEQLMYKDIPFLQQHLGVPFKAVLMKGRSNYLCLRRLARAERHGGELFKSSLEYELERLRAWSQKTQDGSVQELQEQPPTDVWNAVNVEHGNCMWHKCPEYSPCFLMRARNEARDADLLVVNHHLFFSDMALRAHGAAILPDAGLAVLDEAHQLENVASEHLGLRLSQYQFEHWLRRLYVAENSKGLLAVLRKGEAAHVVSRIHEAVEEFFGAVRKAAGLSREKLKQVIGSPLVIETALPGLITQLLTQLRAIHDELEDLDLRAELNAARRRGGEMKDALEAFLRQTLPDSVYWVESEGARRQTVLYSAPVEVAPLLQQSLFGQLGCVVMTSATLAVQGQLEYFRSRVGADAADTLSVGSPFDYERQMRIFIPRGMPDPNQFEPYAEASARAIRRYVERTQGRAFVLFTADRMMKAVAERLRGELTDQRYDLFVQNEGLPRSAMLDRFRSSKRGVLFGLDSFWMGVDVRGEALSNVIITKLPFAVPDEPVVKARMDRIQANGGDPFRDYALPEAILKFRQGVGRLIRSSTDTGIVVILDPRVLSKWYGRQFLASIPECPVEVEEDS